MKSKAQLYLAVTAVLLFPLAAPSQMVIHAMTGTVTAADLASKSLTVIANDGSVRNFTTTAAAPSSFGLDHDLETGTVVPASFSKIGDQVVVYFTGSDDGRTAVALRDLGSGPFVKLSGVVTHYDRHTRTVTLKPETGSPQDFHLDEHSVVETSLGVVDGSKASVHKGDQIRITAATQQGNETALFVRSI